MKITQGQRWLADYVQTGSETAFGNLVKSYLNLVYSAAHRIVGGDAQKAEDVTQIVFADLARKAQNLARDPMLGGWLHRHTCFIAATLMRTERRRLARERQALELDIFQDHSDLNFSHVAPVLHEAIDELEEPDRAAILLRFFEQHEFRTIGEIIGASEDATRMRVSRALEKLEPLLKKRGITSTGGALSVVLLANAAQTAPAGLAMSITSVALTDTAICTSTAVAVSKTVAMTTLQKFLVASILVTLAGSAVYEGYQNSLLRHQVQIQQQQEQPPLAEQLRLAQSERAEATNRIAALLQRIENLKRNDLELLRLRDQVGQLKRTEQGNLERLQALTSLEADAMATRTNRDQQLLDLKKGFARDLASSVQIFWAHHGQRMPDSLSDALAYATSSFDSATATLRESNSITTNQFELMGPPVTLASERVINLIIREKQPVLQGNGTWSRVYADGSGCVYAPTSTTGDFSAWERDHWTLPAPQVGTQIDMP